MCYIVYNIMYNIFRGHLCEVCGNNEVIYPWDACAISCQQCLAVYHRACWSKRNHSCSRCVRLEKRRALEEGEPSNIKNLSKNESPEHHTVKNSLE